MSTVTRRMRSTRRVASRRQQSGFVLIMVLGALVVMAFVAARFAARVDELRRNALGLTDYASARASASSAQASALYWMATRQLMPAGRGDGVAVLREDGRSYRMPDGARVSVQDLRGLLSLNSMNRPVLLNLLLQDGLEFADAQAWLDMLEDYVDTDDLKRLNGAERAEYVALGLTPPRNDWLLSVRELERIPLWRADSQRLVRLSRLFNVAITNVFNPNTAPLAVLRAVLLSASPAQLDLVMSLRQADLLTSGDVAKRFMGLEMDRDDYLFAPGDQSRLKVWAPGLPSAMEYTVSLTPADPLGPWVVNEMRQASRPDTDRENPAASEFPLALAGRAPAVAAGPVAR